ncbi:hypothetical protein SAMN05216344_112118 [Polaromonas sp. OV174]|uniref:hypothetical protein n=1 Tax=Polaromonas sp. OV174 TaxID=1855300 RepID=UPI0008F230E0|nr:hypothetical protein [Polaromonas sp. OV174]SFC26325.1 hypothetical protein SAMN05216344_112118 [Polaromonas sp. OV174]
MDASRVNTIKGRAPLRASSAVRQALARRGKGVGSISYAYSPKTHRDVVLSSDLELCHFLSLEGRSDVYTYDLDPDRILAHLGSDGYVGSKPDAIVTLRSRRRCLVEVKYQSDVENDLRTSLQIQVQQQEALIIGADWGLYTDEQAFQEERFLHDWLQVVATLSGAVDITYKNLEKDIIATVEQETEMSLRQLQLRKFSDWPAVFSCVFQLCQRGDLLDDLRESPLDWSTTIRLGK